ncbi:MAG: rRNA maturation RNase YbeY [Bacillota bacterium]|jgi:probable rRNA maturation factor|nr:rRNA maturation RNase YbeY [Candidatus Fermentithermobacillaceae bacterium]
MTVEVTTNLLSEISPRQMGFLKKLASRVIRYTLRREGVDSRKVQVSVLFTCDDFIASLNKRYRDEEGPTDVLAFPMNEGEDSEDIDPDIDPYVEPDVEPDIEPGVAPDVEPGVEPVGPSMPLMLGDIVISLDTASRQAESQGKPLRQELALLLVHGTLHLLGYDHDDPQKEAIMWAKQDAILKALNI